MAFTGHTGPQMVTLAFPKRKTRAHSTHTQMQVFRYQKKGQRALTVG